MINIAELLRDREYFANCILSLEGNLRKADDVHRETIRRHIESLEKKIDDINNELFKNSFATGMRKYGNAMKKIADK